MAELPAWKVTLQKAEDDNDPLADFISSLPPPTRSEWEALVRLLGKRGDTLHGNRVLVHEHGLIEFRGDDVTIFYKRKSVVNEIIVLGGCCGSVEKTQFDAFLKGAEKV